MHFMVLKMEDFRNLFHMTAFSFFYAEQFYLRLHDNHVKNKEEEVTVNPKPQTLKKIGFLNTLNPKP